MIQEILYRHGTTLVQRLILEAGEGTPWHVDPYYRVTVVVRGEALAIEYRDGGAPERLEVRSGQTDLDTPTERGHRAVNLGATTYEEVAIFFLDRPDAIPQPGAE